MITLKVIDLIDQGIFSWIQQSIHLKALFFQGFMNSFDILPDAAQITSSLSWSSLAPITRA